MALIEGLSPLDLNEDGRKVLEAMRATAEPSRLAQSDPKAAEGMVESITIPMLSAAGLPISVVTQYRWFLREVVRILRTRTGQELAFYCELTMRKWLRYGLEPNTMQVLLAEVWKRAMPGAS